MSRPCPREPALRFYDESRLLGQGFQTQRQLSMSSRSDLAPATSPPVSTGISDDAMPVLRHSLLDLRSPPREVEISSTYSSRPSSYGLSLSPPLPWHRNRANPSPWTSQKSISSGSRSMLHALKILPAFSEDSILQTSLKSALSSQFKVSCFGDFTWDVSFFSLS